MAGRPASNLHYWEVSTFSMGANTFYWTGHQGLLSEWWGWAHLPRGKFTFSTTSKFCSATNPGFETQVSLHSLPSPDMRTAASLPARYYTGPGRDSRSKIKTAVFFVQCQAVINALIPHTLQSFVKPTGVCARGEHFLHLDFRDPACGEQPLVIRRCSWVEWPSRPCPNADGTKGPAGSAEAWDTERSS